MKFPRPAALLVVLALFAPLAVQGATPVRQALPTATMPLPYHLCLDGMPPPMPDITADDRGLFVLKIAQGMDLCPEERTLRKMLNVRNPDWLREELMGIITDARIVIAKGEDAKLVAVAGLVAIKALERVREIDLQIKILKEAEATKARTGKAHAPKALAEINRQVQALARPAPTKAADK